MFVRELLSSVYDSHAAVFRVISLLAVSDCLLDFYVRVGNSVLAQILSHPLQPLLAEFLVRFAVSVCRGLTYDSE